jgi:hypothetical protein
MQGKIDEAIGQFREALSLQPEDPNFKRNLERALEVKLHPEQAGGWGMSRLSR